MGTSAFRGSQVSVLPTGVTLRKVDFLTKCSQCVSLPTLTATDLAVTTTDYTLFVFWSPQNYLPRVKLAGAYRNIKACAHPRYLATEPVSDPLLYKLQRPPQSSPVLSTHSCARPCPLSYHIWQPWQHIAYHFKVNKSFQGLLIQISR